MTITPETLPDDLAALKRIIAEMARDAVGARAEIAKLKFQLARYRRAEFRTLVGEIGARGRAARTGARGAGDRPSRAAGDSRARGGGALFAGSDAGGARAAAIYSLIETATLNGLDPQRYLTDVLARIVDHPARQIAELLPWHWEPDELKRAA